ncbi:MAG: trehalose-6-phosphate synthase [bacterium]
MEDTIIKEGLGLKNKIIGVGVDRIDYTKGLIEKVLAIDRFFEKYPNYKKKMVFIQLAAPSRVHIKRMCLAR